MKKTKVLIVEDSETIREMLVYIINGDPRLEILGVSSSAEEAFEFLDKHRPDVISLDIRLPGMSGLDAISRIMSSHPTPIVVISSIIEGEGLQTPMNAFRAGALCVLEKPRGLTHRDYGQYAENICNQLIAMSTVKLVRQRFLKSISIDSKDVEKKNLKEKKSFSQARFNSRRFKMLAVVSSTGGPNALLQIFQGLPASFPLPIVLVQHITGCFLKGFTEWLTHNTLFPVNIAYTGEVPKPGTIYVAPPDHHLEVTARHLRLSRGQPVCSQRPSGNVLFRSMAHALHEESIGVILTGMGNDGADGLLEVRKVGGYTIAEDETTAVIFGMPAAAIQMGAACEVLPLNNIAPHILELLDMEVEGAVQK